MQPPSSPFGVLKPQRRMLLWVNVAYFGIVLLGMLVVAVKPSIQSPMLTGIGSDLNTLFDQFDQISGGRVSGWVQSPTLLVVLAGAGLIFLVNLILGSFIEITLPSLIIPFAGLFIGGVRAFLWGLIFSPFGRQENLTLPVFLIQVILIFLEGEGYVLALTAAFQHGVAVVSPRSVGVTTHWQGYVEGLKRSALWYAWVIVTLIAAALYESAMVFWVIPALTR